jgi:hypothetical protein
VTSEKKKFRVVGVQYNKKMPTYAAAIETAANKLDADGYTFQLHDQDDGSILFGVLREENPLSALPGHLRPQGAHPAALKFNPRTKALFNRIMDASGDSWEAKPFLEAVQKKMPGLLHGFNADELTTAAEEFAREAEAHARTHDADSECSLPEILKAVSEMLKVAARAQLQ